MKYRCTHCQRTFELAADEYRRCPKCFWTTSLVNVAEGKVEKEVPVQTSEKPYQPKAKRSFPLRLILTVALLAAVLFSVLFLVRAGYHKKISLKFPGTQQKPAEKSQNGAVTSISKEIPEAEKTQLTKPLLITVPRQITEDEEEILKKQVSIPSKIFEKPAVVLWSKEDFEKMLAAEQKSRKIELPWGYEKRLKKIFNEHATKAASAFSAGDYLAARNHFINSLSFPVYQNNHQLHRAVVLVMLRPFINDVIGKIAVLNQYLMAQGIVSEVHAIFSAYQELFPVFELQEWDKVLTLISALKNQIQALEQKPKQPAAPYPPSFGLLDQELQHAVQTEADPKPEAAVNLKALTVDLNLKEKVVKSNTAEELNRVQKQYQQAILLLEESRLEEARDLLRSIEFPPELVDDIKIKLEIIEKILALRNSQSQSTNQ